MKIKFYSAPGVTTFGEWLEAEGFELNVKEYFNNHLDSLRYTAFLDDVHMVTGQGLEQVYGHGSSPMAAIMDLRRFLCCSVLVKEVSKEEVTVPKAFREAGINIYLNGWNGNF